MYIPVTINKNLLKIYNKVSDFDWDATIPKSLSEICIRAIANNWQEKPVLNEIVCPIDRCLLLDLLSTDLPFKLTIPIINDDIYWKKCYLQRWPKILPRNIDNENEEKNWKNYYLEMHLKQYLEQLNPTEYDAEHLKSLSDLCSVYIKTLSLSQLQSSVDSSNHIPLNSILTGFNNLSELSLCFKQQYSGENFTWNTVTTSLQDIYLLAKGLEKSNLSIFRITNSDIDDTKMLRILRSLQKHENLKTIDISHCQISDKAVMALCKLSLIIPVQNLILKNNKIGAAGIEALCYVLCHKSCQISVINLKLNPLGAVGGDLLIKTLTIGGSSLKNLCLNGCGLTKNCVGIEVMLEENTNLETLELSNNKLGIVIGESVVRGLKYNTSLKNIDIRMCDFTPKVELDILNIVGHNKDNHRKIAIPKIVKPKIDFEISQDLLHGIEQIFLETQDDLGTSELNDLKL